MKIDIASYTNNGGHNFNEDSYGVGDNVFVVADGLGSHGNSKDASACTVDYLLKNSDADITMTDEQILEKIDSLNNAVLKMQEETGYTDARTTVAAAWTGGGRFRCANVGDSRVYFLRQGRIISQTKDHSLCQASVELGQMDYDDIRQSPDRSSLLKVIGENEKLKLTKIIPPIEIYNGDAFIICSDGFWDYVYEEEMEIDFHKSENADEWLRYMLRRHLSRAKNEGDNYTVICGIIHSENVYTPVIPPVPRKKSGTAKKSSISLPVLIAAIAAIIAGIVFLAFRYLAPDNDDAHTTETSASEDNIIVTDEQETENGNNQEDVTDENGNAEETTVIPDETQETTVSPSETDTIGTSV